MTFFQSLFSSSRSQPGDAHDRDIAQQGPETTPAKMNLEERMAFRRELLFESIRTTLKNNYITPGSYRFKVMRTDKRGHCYVLMLDMSSAFMDSEQGQHAQLATTAAALIKNAQARYGLVVTGVYWRLDEALDAALVGRERPATAAGDAATPFDRELTNVEKYQQATEEDLAVFEQAWQKSSDIQIGSRTYSSDIAPLMEDPTQK